MAEQRRNEPPRIPVKVSYRCSMCGHENVDIEGQFTPDHFSSMGRHAAEDIRHQLQKVVKDSLAGQYIGYGLVCSCESCGKQEAWSEKNSGTIPLVSVVLALLVFVGIVVTFRSFSGFFAGFMTMMAIMLYTRMRRDKEYNQKIVALPNESLPRVTLYPEDGMAQPAPAAEKIAEEKPGDPLPAEELPADEGPAEDAPAGDAPAGE